MKRVARVCVWILMVAGLGVAALGAGGCASWTERHYKVLTWHVSDGEAGGVSCRVSVDGDGREVARLTGDVCTLPPGVHRVSP